MSPTLDPYSSISSQFLGMWTVLQCLNSSCCQLQFENSLPCENRERNPEFFDVFECCSFIVMVAILLFLAALIGFILEKTVTAGPESPSFLTTPQQYHISDPGGIAHTATFQQRMPDLVWETLHRDIPLWARQVCWVLRSNCPWWAIASIAVLAEHHPCRFQYTESSCCCQRGWGL